MAANTLSELIKTVRDGEDGDEAYRRLYADQVKPCDFRRWFATVQRDKTTNETDDATIEAIKEYLELGMIVDEAFKDFCPDYVGPGEFHMAYEKEIRSRKAAAALPAAAVVDEPPGDLGETE